MADVETNSSALRGCRALGWPERRRGAWVGGTGVNGVESANEHSRSWRQLSDEVVWVEGVCCIEKVRLLESSEYLIENSLHLSCRSMYTVHIYFAS